MVKKVSFWLLVALVVVVVVSAGWGIPLKIAFSGRLTDSSGKVITKVNDVTFKLFDSESGGTQLGSAITLSGPRNLPNGIINTTLDVPSNVFQTNDNVWLEVSFTPDGGNLTTLSRQQIVSVPFAYRAEEADKVGGMTTREVINAATSEALAQVPAGLWAKTGDNISNTNTGNVGIGMTRPIAKLHLQVSGTDAYAGLGITSSLDEGKTITINQGTAGKLNFTVPKIIDLMTLDFNTGKVGIGTTTPTSELTLYSPAADASGGMIRQEIGTVSGEHRFLTISRRNLNSLYDWTMAVREGFGPSLDFYRVYRSSENPDFLYSMTLDWNGNVGIGTTEPTAKLHLQVSGTDAYAGLGITSSRAGGKTITINQGTAGKLNFTEPKVIDLMTLDFNTGNVGIGTTSPTHKLDVNGSATIGNQDSPFMVKTFSSVYVPKGGSAQISIGENKTVYGISGFMKSASKSWPNNQWSFFTTNMDYDSSTGKITIYNNSTDSFNANIIVFYN